MTTNDELANKVEAAIWQREGRREGAEVRFLCLIHEDHTPSARYNPEKLTWFCDVCKKGGGIKDLAERLGIQTNGHKPNINYRLEESYSYELKPGVEHYIIDRKVSDIRGDDGKFKKKFDIRHKVNGEYVYSRDGLTIIPYRLPELREAKAAEIPIRDHEGERKADACLKLGLPATSLPFGANAALPDSYTEELAGADVLIYPDNDQPGEEYALKKAKALFGIARSIKIVHLPGLPLKGDIVDFIKNGGAKEQILEIEANTPYFEVKKHTLDELLQLFRKYYHLPSTAHIELTLAAVAANRGSGDPIWLLIIAPPGWGKTEPLNTLFEQPDIYPVAVLTEASLLSGTARKDVSKGAKGGLLAEMGDFGILLIKDFSGMLSLNKDSRSSILSALREIYDGSWTRYVGVDGGRKLEWRGKCGLVGAATPSIDQHYAVLNTLGERFCYYRMPEEEENKRAEVALQFAGREHEIRSTLVKAVNEFFEGVEISDSVPVFNEGETKKLIALSTFTVRCRSSVERENYQSRDIQLIPGVESPTRLIKVFALLFRGLLDIGVIKERAWSLIQDVALSSMPAIRKKVLLKMIDSEKSEWVTSELGTELGYPSVTVRRVLEDMTCYGIIERISQGQGNADIWKLSVWTLETYAEAFKDLIRNSGNSTVNDSTDNSTYTNYKTHKTEFRIRSRGDTDRVCGKSINCNECDSWQKVDEKWTCVDGYGSD